MSDAFAVLGRKYRFSMPLENPLRFDQVGSTPVDPRPQSVPAYLPGDIPKYSPVVDDNTGRTDQVSFIRDWGIPGYGIIGAYDTSTNPQIGGNENPYPPAYPNKPTLSQYAIYDTSDDAPEHLNYYASGTTHGPDGPSSPSEGLRRALELPATWTSYLIAGDAYGGSETRNSNPKAYFETVPAKPFLTSKVTFDASFSRTGRGLPRGLTYYWDFGDGTTMATPGLPAPQPDPPAGLRRREVRSHTSMSSFASLIRGDGSPAASSAPPTTCDRGAQAVRA